MPKHFSKNINHAFKAKLGSTKGIKGVPDGSTGTESACSAGDTGDVGGAGSVPGLGRSTGRGNLTPVQYSCRGNPVDSGAWWATVHRVTKSQTRLSE